MGYSNYDSYSYPSSGSNSRGSSSSSGKEKYIPVSSKSDPKGSYYPSGSSSSGSKSKPSSMKPVVINGSPYYTETDRRDKSQDIRYYR